jgi:hypothetical protein
VQIERELYAAYEQRLLERLRAVEDDVESLMLIGHNPGVEQLAHRSGRQRAEPDRPPPQSVGAHTRCSLYRLLARGPGRLGGGSGAQFQKGGQAARRKAAPPGAAASKGSLLVSMCQIA